MDKQRAWLAKYDLQYEYDDLSEAISRDPSPENYIRRAKLYWKRGKHRFMTADADAALAADPKSAVALYFRCYLAHLVEDDRPGRALLKKAFRRQPPDAETHYYAGYILAMTGRHSQSLEHLNRALTSGLEGPLRADATFCRAQVWEEIGDYGAAAKAYENARELYPLIDGFEWFEWNIAECRNGQIRISYAQRNYRQALQHAQLGYEESGGSENAANHYATLLAMLPDRSLRNGQLAIEVMRVTDADCTDRTRAEILAAAYAEAGRFDDAIRWQEHVVNDLIECYFKPRHPEMRAAQGLLERYRRGETYPVT